MEPERKRVNFRTSIRKAMDATDGGELLGGLLAIGIGAWYWLRGEPARETGDGGVASEHDDWPPSDVR